MPATMLATKPVSPRAKPWVLVLLALLVAVGPALPVQAQEAIARLLELQGSVEVRRKGDSTWSPAKAGSPLNPGDTLRTLGRSQATVLRSDGTTLELYPLSEATLEDEKAVMLWLGKLWSQFQKAVGRPHEIRTPSSVALIRGTVLAVEADASGASQVAVMEGRVEVVDRQGARREMVGAGFAVRADREGRLQRLERARPDTLDEGRGFVERLERGRHLRQREDRPGPDQSERGASERGPGDRGDRGDRTPEREFRPEDRSNRDAVNERLERRGLPVQERIEQKLRLEERLERGAGERLERLIDRTQREEQREFAEQRRDERRQERLDERAQQDNNRSDAEQREELIERLRDRLKRGL